MQRWRMLLAGLWAGVLLTVALLATPAPFATLASADAGRVVARILAHEAAASLVFGIAMLLLERRIARDAADAGQGSQFSTGMVLALAAIFCTVLGYYVVQPQMAAARGGGSALSFAQWHAVSGSLFAIKMVLVLALAWLAAGPQRS